jgi:acyl-CoA synthetase (NDP forming)
MTRSAATLDAVFQAAEKDGRDTLFEHESYAIFRAAGLETPRHIFLPAGKRISRRDLEALGSSRVVLKIVSPFILHKSDAGGVAFVSASVRAVNDAVTRMIRDVPRKYSAWVRKSHGAGAAGHLSPADVAASIRGVLVCEMVDFADVGFGSELLLGVRNTREFGPVLTFGGGGLDVEHMAAHLKDGHGAALASVHLAKAADVPGLLAPLAFFGKIAAPFRGRKPLVSPAALAAAAGKFLALVRRFSEDGPADFIIEEAEINPLVIRGGGLVPLDALCRFSRRSVPRDTSSPRPLQSVGRLLRPGSIGIIGVSEKMNIGRIILKNILKGGFPASRTFVVKPGSDEIDGCRCVPTVADLPETVDLFVLTLAADQVHGVMKDLVAHERARSVIVIAGGMGEKEGGTSIEEDIRALLTRARTEGRPAPVINGGNCLGVLSEPGRYDTTFIPEHKLPRPKGRRSGLVYLSQSGAFMVSRMSRLHRLEPRYAVSFGNQLDLTVSDYLRHLKDDPESRIFAVYIEGFRPGDGLAFARAVGDVLSDQGRSVVVYKSGRSPEGRAATSSHTASVAGEYDVCRRILEQAGAIVAGDILEFESFVKGLVYLEGKSVRGDRVGLVTNAGFECVIMADSLENGGRLRPAEFEGSTTERIMEAMRPLGIDKLQDVHNPLDLTPVADDAVFCDCVEAILDAENVDCAVVSPVPMTPAMRTLAAGEGHRESLVDPDSFAQRFIPVFRKTDKPVVVNIDAGALYDPFADILEGAGIPVFRRSDEALRFLRRFVAAGLRGRGR